MKIKSKSWKEGKLEMDKKLKGLVAMPGTIKKMEIVDTGKDVMRLIILYLDKLEKLNDKERKVIIDTLILLETPIWKYETHNP